MTDKITVLVMEDADGSNSYYSIPDEWLAWLNDPNTTPPQSLREEYEEHWGPWPDDLAFSLRTLQIFALDSQWIGSLNDLVAHANGREVVEYHGTWF